MAPHGVQVLLRKEILNIASCRAANYERARTSLGGNSADAAERVVKMVILAFGKPFLATHDMHELLADVPDRWKGELEALNGNIRHLHVVNYGEDRPAPEQIRRVCDETAKRVDLTLDVLGRLSEMENPLDADECQRLLSLLMEPDERDDVATMVRRATPHAKRLVDKFTANQKMWLDRLQRDSLE